MGRAGFHVSREVTGQFLALKEVASFLHFCETPAPYSCFVDKSGEPMPGTTVDRGLSKCSQFADKQGRKEKMISAEDVAADQTASAPGKSAAGRLCSQGSVDGWQSGRWAPRANHSGMTFYWDTLGLFVGEPSPKQWGNEEKWGKVWFFKCFSMVTCFW